MEANLPEDRANSLGSQGAKYVPAPAEVVQLRDLREIRELWGFGEQRIYRAVAQGRLRAYGRPGHQKYYSEVELIALYGDPPNGGGPNRPAKMERTAKGGYLRQLELDVDVAA